LAVSDPDGMPRVKGSQWRFWGFEDAWLLAWPQAAYAERVDNPK
jgi:hypothetical protein